MNALFENATFELESIDIFVHSIACANREDMLGRSIDTNRDGFRLTKEISVYSLTVLGREALPLAKLGSSIMASRTVEEVLFVDSGYNIFGLTMPNDLQ